MAVAVIVRMAMGRKTCREFARNSQLVREKE